MRESAVFSKFIDPKIDGLVLRLISEAAFHQCLNHLDHRCDLAWIGGFWKRISALDPQRVEIFEECLLERRGEFRQRNSRLPRSANRLVVDVRDVHHASHLEVPQFEMALQEILEKVSAEISDVRVAVNGGSAGVNLHLASRRIERMKFLQLARVSIEEADCHHVVMSSEVETPRRATTRFPTGFFDSASLRSE